MPTSEELNETLKYKDGKLYWKKAGKARRIGDRVGGVGFDKDGYRIISCNGKRIKEHRAIFLMIHGYLPEHIDHINGIEGDNRIENLRGCTRFENMRNRPPQRGRKYKGVRRRGKKYEVWFTTNGKREYKGMYESEELAAFVYNIHAIESPTAEFEYLNEVYI